MRTYELIPTDSRKSFYKKAIVNVDGNGTETLLSYGTPIVSRSQDGTLTKLWNGYSVTTQRHIVAFCGLNKKEFSNL
jgi:hypothetical protein